MEEKEKVLSIRDIFEVLWRYKVLILALAIVVGSLQFVRIEFFTDDIYAADGRLYVSNLDKAALDEDAVISQWDIESARMMSTTYIEMLKGRSFLIDVSRELGEKYSWQQLYSMIDVQLVNETELLSVTAYATNKKDAYLIVHAFLEKAPEQLFEAFTGEVKIIDEPVMPQAPVDKGLVGNTFVACVIGGVLGVILAFVLKAMDRKIHGSEALAERYDISILGEID